MNTADINRKPPFKLTAGREADYIKQMIKSKWSKMVTNVRTLLKLNSAIRFN